MLELYLQSSPCQLDPVNSTTAALSWSFPSDQTFGEERNKEMLVCGARL
jgi:hypothetical protein